MELGHIGVNLKTKTMLGGQIPLRANKRLIVAGLHWEERRTALKSYEKVCGRFADKLVVLI